MDNRHILSQHAKRVLLGEPDSDARRCTATNRAGERCRRASALGQTVCYLHGAAAPMSIKAARERLAAMVEPALDALLRALQQGPPCPHCGRSDADKDPVVIRAAQIVLDRAGHGPHAEVTIDDQRDNTHDEMDDLSLDQLEERLERALANVRAMKARTPPLLASPTEDAPPPDIEATVVVEEDQFDQG